MRTPTCGSSTAQFDATRMDREFFACPISCTRYGSMSDWDRRIEDTQNISEALKDATLMNPELFMWPSPCLVRASDLDRYVKASDETSKELRGVGYFWEKIIQDTSLHIPIRDTQLQFLRRSQNLCPCVKSQESWWGIQWEELLAAMYY